MYCLELNQYYENATIASNLTQIDYTSICDAANGKICSSGRHPSTKDNLHWTYVSEEEFILNNRVEWIKKYPQDKYSCFKKQKRNSKPVYCEELNRSFESANSSGYSKVDKVCNKIKGHSTSGRHPITKEKLHWKWITLEEHYDDLIRRYLYGES